MTALTLSRGGFIDRPLNTAQSGFDVLFKHEKYILDPWPSWPRYDVDSLRFFHLIEVPLGCADCMIRHWTCHSSVDALHEGNLVSIFTAAMDFATSRQNA
jgi:hypothetical protein